MRTRLALLLAVAAVSAAPAAGATTIAFDDGTANTAVPADRYASAGVTLTPFAFYTDSRDTFDGRGIAPTESASLIAFASPVSNLSLDLLTVGSATDVFLLFDTDDNLLEIFSYMSPASTTNFTHAFTSTNVSQLVLTTSVVGSIGISTLRFDASAVPEPTSWAMMLTGFGVTGLALRRRRKVVVRYA